MSPQSINRFFTPTQKQNCIFSVIATLFGVCTSLGLGTMQINRGLHLLQVPQMISPPSSTGVSNDISVLGKKVVCTLTLAQNLFTAKKNLKPTHLQGCISCGMCSYPELNKDHVLTSAYVKIFRTVTRNAVNKSV